LENGKKDSTMKSGLQLVKWLVALSVCAMMALPSFAEQHPHGNGGQNRPPKPPAAHPQRPAPQNNSGNRPPQGSRQENRPSNPNSSRTNDEARLNPNRPPNVQRQLTPQERQKNERQFSSLSPQRQQEIRDGEKNWRRLTPEQQGHIKNDIAPKYQQLPADRQRAIRSRLNVLKNMPESARNQHLNDPNFTRGMNEEDKAMLRDLAHMHVGGAPEAPPNE
jgi:hypothetical protein